jgi:GH24 family phage-related lysozyme (muramidase)
MNVPPCAALPAVDFDVAMEVASHEALIRQTYKDSVGVLTWCVGMTNATGHKVDRYIGKPAALQHCMNIFAWALQNYAVGVYRAFKGYSINKGQFAAALSFHWNTGSIEKALWVTLWKQGKTEEAKAAFMNWDNPPEITDRRRKERDLFFDGKWSHNGKMTEYTRLTKKMTPVWSSAVKIDVSKELRAAFAAPVTVPLDVPMQPEAPVVAPTVSPGAEPAKQPSNYKRPAIPGWLIAALVIIALAAAGAFFIRF